MIKGCYRKPVLRTIGCLDLLEMMGPGCAQSGQLNMDMYRGSAMLEKACEYRFAKKMDLNIKSLDNKDNVQEVAHV